MRRMWPTQVLHLEEEAYTPAAVQQPRPSHKGGRRRGAALQRASAPAWVPNPNAAEFRPRR